jgi:hypothetical protein
MTENMSPEDEARLAGACRKFNTYIEEQISALNVLDQMLGDAQVVAVSARRAEQDGSQPAS